MTEQTLRTWLRAEIAGVLTTDPPPLILWCDPELAWRDLLQAAAEGESFELWADGEHELVLRDRLLKAEPAPRMVWLPVTAEETVAANLLDKPAAARRERGWLDVDEAALLLEACRAYRPKRPDLALHDLHAIVAAALLTGARPSEVLNLRVRDVSLGRGAVRLAAPPVAS